MTDLQRNTDHQCQCAQCRASRALDVLRALPSLPDDGRGALDTIEAALNELEEKGFARWEAMNDVATAAGLNWMDATQQDIVNAIKQTRARVAELEAALAAQQWRPVGGNPPPAGRMFEIRRANCSLFPTCAYGKPAKKAVGSIDGEFICWWVFGNGWEWRPHYELQPAPDQEPK